MRILVMGTGQGLGGLRTHLQGLLHFLVEENHETYAVVVADAAGGVLPSPGVRKVYRVPHNALNLWTKLQKYRALLRCETEINRLKPDLFIATAPGKGYAQLALCARKNGSFTIWQEVSIPALRDPLHTRMARSVEAVAVQSPGMMRPFCQAIPGATRVGCLPCFFDAPESAESARLPKEGEPVKLAYFGRLAGNKGLEPFLDVFREVSAKFPVRLDIHGDGEKRAPLERLINDAGLKDLVYLKGRYPTGLEYENLLTSYHGLVLPSIACEGVPLVLLEAMSCGLPFLSTNIGGISDLHNQDVLVVEPGREALFDGLTQFLQRLVTGQISNVRLQNYYYQHCSRRSVAGTWRVMLADRKTFFKSTQTAKV